jgi:hypothetical protein
MISKSLEFAEKSEFSGEKPQKFEKRKKLGLRLQHQTTFDPSAAFRPSCHLGIGRSHKTMRPAEKSGFEQWTIQFI